MGIFTFLASLPQAFLELSSNVKAILGILNQAKENGWYNDLSKQTKDANNAATREDQVNAAKQLQDIVKRS